MPRMRTIGEAYNHLKALDKDTCITLYSIRRMVKSGEIPTVMSGKKYLINIDNLLEYLEHPQPLREKKQTGIIRSIGE